MNESKFKSRPHHLHLPPQHTRLCCCGRVCVVLCLQAVLQERIDLLSELTAISSSLRCAMNVHVAFLDLTRSHIHGMFHVMDKHASVAESAGSNRTVGS